MEWLTCSEKVQNVYLNLRYFAFLGSTIKNLEGKNIEIYIWFLKRIINCL